jgi:hypothetical protein
VFGVELDLLLFDFVKNIAPAHVDGRTTTRGSEQQFYKKRRTKLSASISYNEPLPT